MNSGDSLRITAFGFVENPADRGMLLDRKGRILAHNRPSFEVSLVPEDLKVNPEVLTKVGELLHMGEDEIKDKLQSSKNGLPSNR